MSSHNTSSSLLSGPVHNFPEEDLRSDGKDNPGYFPAWLGLLLQGGRYCITRKLGWGQNSSVWLVRDFELRRFAALKIMTVEATKALDANRSDEVALLQKVVNADRSHEGSRRVVEYYDTFTIDGPHGQHCCVLTEVLTLDLDTIRLRSPTLRLPLNLVKFVTQQVLLGLDFLHTSCGIVHADLKHDCVLFRPDSIHAMIADNTLREPAKTYDAPDASLRPPIPVVTQVLSPSFDPLSTAQIAVDVVLVDLSRAQRRERHFDEMIQSYALRAPEVYLGYPWDTPADVWSLGCLAIEWLAGFWLFEPDAEKDWERVEDHLARMTEVTEEQFLPEMLSKCKNRSEYFNEDGTFIRFTQHRGPNIPLRDLFRKFSEFSDDEREIDGAAEFFKRCLRLRPEDRASAQQLAKDPWLAQTQYTSLSTNN